MVCWAGLKRPWERRNGLVNVGGGLVDAGAGGGPAGSRSSQAGGQLWRARSGDRPDGGGVWYQRPGACGQRALCLGRPDRNGDRQCGRQQHLQHPVHPRAGGAYLAAAGLPAAGSSGCADHGRRVPPGLSAGLERQPGALGSGAAFSGLAGLYPVSFPPGAQGIRQ